jgi:hypothetical protein
MAAKRKINIKELDVKALPPNKENCNDPLQGGMKILIIGKPGCFAPGTMVLMYDGSIRTIENVNSGEQVMGPDSKPRTVASLCSDYQSMYEVSLEDGERVVVNAKHILSLWNTETCSYDDITVEAYDELNIETKRVYVWTKAVLDKEGAQLYDITESLYSLPLKQRKILLEGIVGFSWKVPPSHLVAICRSVGYIVRKLVGEEYEVFTRDHVTTQYGKAISMSFSVKKSYFGRYYGFEIEDNDHRFVLGDMSIVHNTGKCLAPGTLCLMADGTVKKVEDLAVGEELMGDDSTPREILSTCTGKETMYKVSQSAGENYVVNESHILTLYSTKDLETVDIPLLKYVGLSKEERGEYLGQRVVVQFPTVYTSSDPYDYGFGMDKDGVIPKEYVINSYNVRMEFLAGLLDKHGILCDSVITVSVSDCKTACNMARLLGLHAAHFIESFCIFGGIHLIPLKSVQVSTDRPFQTSNDTYSHSPPTLYSQYASDSLPSKYSHLRYPITVTEMKEGVYHGFEINGNGRFLLRDGTVTHNTTLLKSLLYEKSDMIPYGVMISGTEDSNDAFTGFFHPLFVYNDLNLDMLKDYIRRQKLAKKYLPVPWGLLGMDDMGADTKVFNHKLFHEIIKNSRHYKSWFILAVQYLKDVKPVFRSNVDGVFILRENSISNRRALFDNFGGAIGDFTLFCSLLDVLTEDYTAMYIDNRSLSYKVEECVYYYKAKAVPEWFNFGSKDCWDFGNDRYNEEYLDDI